MKSNFVLLIGIVTIGLLAGCSGSIFKQGKVIAHSKVTTLEFTEYKKLIFVRASINGIEGNFLIDNGFSLSAVTENFAKKVGLHFEDHITVSDYNNKKSKIRRTMVDTVQFSDHYFVNTGFFEVDLKHVFPCHKVDGVIGGSIFNKANWDIDFKTNTLSISLHNFEGPGTIMPLTGMDNNNAITEVFFENNRLQAKIDLGKSKPMSIHKSKISALDKQLDAEERTGIFSISLNGVGNPDTLQIIRNYKGLYNTNGQLPAVENVELVNHLKKDAYIGIDYFNNMHVSFNMLNNQIIIREEYPYDEATLQRYANIYPASIYPVNDTWVVIQKSANDPIVKDVQLMSSVTQINELPLTDKNQLCAYLELKEDAIQNQRSLQLKIEGLDTLVTLPYARPVEKKLSF